MLTVYLDVATLCCTSSEGENNRNGLKEDASNRDRPSDLGNFSATLSQLSYRGFGSAQSSLFDVWYRLHKVPLRDRVGLKSHGCRNLKRGNKISRKLDVESLIAATAPVARQVQPTIPNKCTWYSLLYKCTIGSNDSYNLNTSRYICCSRNLPKNILLIVAVLLLVQQPPF